MRKTKIRNSRNLKITVIFFITSRIYGMPVAFLCTNGTLTSNEKILPNAD